MGHPEPRALYASVVATAPCSAHTCALVDDGTMQCWGNNNYGDLGNDSGTPSSMPVSVQGLPAAAAGSLRTCASFVDGSVSCWGYFFVATTLSPVTGLADVAAIAVGLYHICASLENGSVRCQGGNSGGNKQHQSVWPTGDGTTADR